MTFQGRCGLTFKKSYEQSSLVYNEKTGKIDFCNGMLSTPLMLLKEDTLFPEPTKPFHSCQFCNAFKEHVLRVVTAHEEAYNYFQTKIPDTLRRGVSASK